jgi:7-carboxy-7-deazaguanine synthase
VQGEGVRTGVPSYFIRLSGCNLRCRWCDTPYASWEARGQRRTIDDLVAGAVASGAPDAVITGGEPLIFEGVADLTAALRAAGLHVTIETAGTVAPTPLPRADLLSLSPKLADSTPREGDPRDPGGHWARRHEQRRINVAALQALLDAHPAPSRQIKFVVSSHAELAEIDSLLEHLHGWTDADVLLMPEGVADPAPGATRWLVDACIARRWRYCARLHIALFGNTRGT